MICPSMTDKLHEAAAPIWAKCLSHPFVTGIGDGTLDTHSMRENSEEDNQRFLIHILPKNIIEDEKPDNQ